ncbi:MAG: hypothetical protein SPJ70_05165 [Candidatus Borkfalkiaceae bacterium]|nr:hypothetical protein [Eubacteriales bacterium]MDY5820679.1 hypothetical protein [Christensenellaceae bacterium]
MNDGREYAEMLRTMASSCDVVVKPAKRARKKKDVKEEIVTKVNDEVAASEVKAADELPFKEEAFGEEEIIERPKKRFSFFGKKKTETTEKPAEKKGRFKFDIVYAEGIAAFALVVAILLTNIFWENSGMNTFFKKAFSPAQVTTDARSYNSFNAQSPSSSLDGKVEDGVMTFSGKGALYPVCDGKVSSVKQSDDGKYEITIAHSGSFKTVISGVDYSYCDENEEVFKYIPVCYLNGGEAKVYMYNDDALVTNYVLENGSIIWSV